MPYENLLVEIGKGRVGGITLNRPDDLNTFSTPMAAELLDALVKMDADPDVRVVLIKGAGKAFCAGIDVKELPDKTAMQYREWIERMERPLVAVSRMRKPVIVQFPRNVMGTPDPLT